MGKFDLIKQEQPRLLAKMSAARMLAYPLPSYINKWVSTKLVNIGDRTIVQNQGEFVCE
jgi:hypothetical protein